jgi:hypothetical protein
VSCRFLSCFFFFCLNLVRSSVEKGVWGGKRVGNEWDVPYREDGTVCGTFSREGVVSESVCVFFPPSVATWKLE